MCEDCGCHEGNEKKYFGHAHSHVHHHPHTHDHESAENESKNDAQTRVLNIEHNILAKNNHIASHNREWLTEKNVLTINLISSPGSGKTTLLQKTLKELKGKLNCSVIVGDQSTDNDAKKLKEHCENVYQIETKSSCHLTAEQVSKVLPEVVDEKTEVLFIENVGNLICPAAFDLGENFKIALLSTTEGEDKPVKYPVIFSDAKVVIMTKTDLIPHLNWDVKKCRNSIRQINPGVFVFELSAASGEGMSDWINYLRRL
ncbi:MAG: hydrogenase nickel incorporation protein HypB [Victivallales bacterium]|nr:hydrogenase nickel incorporation protein HypB [Victivallales bacterium]